MLDESAGVVELEKKKKLKKRHMTQHELHQMEKTGMLEKVENETLLVV